MSVVTFILHGPHHASFIGDPQTIYEYTKVSCRYEPYPYKKLDQYKNLSTGDDVARITTRFTDSWGTWIIDTICEVSNPDCRVINQYRRFRNLSLTPVLILTGLAAANLLIPFLPVPSITLFALSIFCGFRSYQAHYIVGQLATGAKMVNIMPYLENRKKFYAELQSDLPDPGAHVAPFELEMRAIYQLHQSLDLKSASADLNALKKVMLGITSEAKAIKCYMNDSLKITWSMTFCSELVEEVNQLDFQQKLSTRYDGVKNLSSCDVCINRLEQSRKGKDFMAVFAPVKAYLDALKLDEEKSMQPSVDLQKESAKLFLADVHEKLKDYHFPFDQIPENSKFFTLLEEVGVTRKEFLESYDLNPLL